MAYVYTARFNPFTYDELVKPLQHYAEAYEKAQTQYDNLSMETAALFNSLDPQSQAYQNMKGYYDELMTNVDDFSKGMNLQNSSALTQMKRRFASDVIPIKQAQENYNEAIKERRKLGTDAIYQRGSFTIDDFLNGNTPNLDYTSEKFWTDKASKLTQNAMAELMEDPEVKSFLGGQYYMLTQHTGGSYDQLQEALKMGIFDNPKVNNRFMEIKQRLMNEAGISKYDEEGQQRIMGAIDAGLYDGLDKPVRSMQANRGYSAAPRKKFGEDFTPVDGYDNVWASPSLRLYSKNDKGEWVNYTGDNAQEILRKLKAAGATVNSGVRRTLKNNVGYIDLDGTIDGFSFNRKNGKFELPIDKVFNKNSITGEWDLPKGTGIDPSIDRYDDSIPQYQKDLISYLDKIYGPETVDLFNIIVTPGGRAYWTESGTTKSSVVVPYSYDFSIGQDSIFSPGTQEPGTEEPSNGDPAPSNDEVNLGNL